MRVAALLLASALFLAQPAALRAQTGVFLDGLSMVYQDVNRCSAAALTMHLSYFSDAPVSYRDVIAQLNPHAEDVSVRIEEMLTVAEGYGLKGVVRRAGTIDLLKRLIDAGLPVLVENSYYEGADRLREWLSHNRVLVGYDDATRLLFFYDSLLGIGDGRGRAFDYDDYDERWLPFNRDYLVLYPPEKEATVQILLGDDWDMTRNAENALAQAERDAAAASSLTNRAFALMNMGWAYVQLGRFAEAAAAYDEALKLPLPTRYFWYEFGVFEAYLGAGRYDDVITLARKTLQGVQGVEELYYYVGRAAEAQGDRRRAQGNYEMAIFRNSRFTEAREALDRLLASP